jgi:lipopolysaccharide export system permease protein
MKTIRRLLYRDILWSVVFVALAFASLQFFFDFVRALEQVGRRGVNVGDAVVTTLLEVPANLYELWPIAVLIGAIFTLSRLAQTSEFTILRTGGLGPGRALGLLMLLGLGFALVTLLTGDVVAPLSARLSTALKIEASGGRDLGQTGAWLRDQRQTQDGSRTVSVNVSRVGRGGVLEGIRIYEFDGEGRLLTRIIAEQGRLEEATEAAQPAEGRDAATGPLNAWSLKNARAMHWDHGKSTQAAFVKDEQHDSMTWPTQLDIGVVSAAVQPTATMTTWELWRYANHLSDNEQTAQRQTIQFWKKAFYPLSCLVMMALALPFAYLNARSGGISLRVFGGIVLGISFLLLNSVAEHLGVLSGWTPWIVAASPSLLFMAISLGAFAWLVRYR